MIKHGPKPMILEVCGCWKCKDCDGKGHVLRQEGNHEIREECNVCDASGYLKLCPHHAKTSGWLEEKNW